MTRSPNTRAVPRDVADVARFIDNFRAQTGLTPIAGGETMLGVPPQSPPQQGQPAGPIPPPAPQGTPESQPQATPPEAPQAQQSPAGQQPPAEDAALQQILARLDEFQGEGPAMPPDPYAVELGLMQPPPAMPGQPQAQPGAPALPGQSGAPMAQPGQPQQPGAQLPGVQGVQPQEADAIARWVQQEATKAAERMIQERVDPRFENQERVRRQAEIASLVEDFPEYRDPQQAQQLLATARNWSRQMSGSEDLAREPAFLEMTIRAGQQMRAAQSASAGGPTPPSPASGEVPIETPGPAAPAGAVNPQDEIGQRIVQAGNGTGLAGLWH